MRLLSRGGSDRIDGVVEGVLRVRVAVPAVDDAANQALVRMLADELGVPRRDVRLVAGAAGPTKLVTVDGLSVERLLERWPGLRT